MTSISFANVNVNASLNAPVQKSFYSLPPIDIDSIEQTAKFNGEIAYYEDVDGQLSLTDIQRRLDSFIPLVATDLSPFVSESHFWFHFSVTNNNVDKKEFLLQLLDAHLEHVTLYIPSRQGVDKKVQGASEPFEQRDVPTHFPTFRLTLESGETQAYFLRIHSNSALTIPIRFFSNATFTEHMNELLIVLVIHLSVIFTMAIYNQFLIFATRDSNYFNYGVAISLMAGALVWANGWQMTWFPNNDWVGKNAIYILSSFAGAGSLFFIRSFCSTRLTHPRLDVWVCGFMVAGVLFGIISAFNFSWLIRFLSLGCAVASALIAFLVSYVSLRSGFRPARFLVAGWGVVFVGTSITVMANLGLMPPNTLYKEALKWGQLLETILMSFALGDRIRILRQDEREARINAEIADARSTAKSEFLAQMSHEIRTPMNGVLGMAELLQQSRLSEEQRHQVDTISASGRALLHIINDILDFSKIEAGKMRLEKITFAVKDVVEDCISVFAFSAKQKNIEIRYFIAEEVSEHVIGDPNRLRQVLLNLVSNGLKFTTEGSIEIRVYLDLDDDTCLRFEVEDTGAGISAEAQEALFEAFSQADDSISRKYGGTGLGLSICKQLVSLMEGKIGVASEDGKGSLFWFTGVFIATDKEAESTSILNELLPHEPKLFAQLNVLVADDNIVNQMVLASMLERLSVQATVVSDGAEAFAAVKKSAPKFDLVFMDCDMPVMDGLQATQEIRKLESQQQLASTKIVALTAHANAAYEKECLAVGMNAYITKPVLISQVIEQLRLVVSP